MGVEGKFGENQKTQHDELLCRPVPDSSSSSQLTEWKQKFKFRYKPRRRPLRNMSKTGIKFMSRLLSRDQDERVSPEVKRIASPNLKPFTPEFETEADPDIRRLIH